MSWQNEDLKPGDRVAQAGLVLVEQALFNDAMNVPAQGVLKTPDRNGNVEINAPGFSEFVNSMRQHDSDGSSTTARAYHEDIDTVKDSSGRKLQTLDEQDQAYLLDIVTTNKWDTRAILRDGNGALQYQLQGKTNITTKDGKFRDDAYIVFNPNGDQLPVRIEIVGQATPDGNGLTITATSSYADDKGNAIPGWDGKPQVLGTVVETITADPSNPTGAAFTLKKTGTPLLAPAHLPGS